MSPNWGAQLFYSQTHSWMDHRVTKKSKREWRDCEMQNFSKLGEGTSSNPTGQVINKNIGYVHSNMLHLHSIDKLYTFNYHRFANFDL